MTKLNRSVERGLDIIDVLLAEGPSSLGFLAKKTELPKATVFRLCATLEKRRWVLKRTGDGCYQLGSKIAALTTQSSVGDRLVAVGKREILSLSNQTQLAVDLAASIGNGRVEIVDTTRMYQRHKIPADCIGYRPSPLRTALGLSFLAAMPSETFAETIPKLAQTVTRDDRAALENLPEAFKELRERGFAMRETNYWGRAVDRGHLPAAIGIAIVSNGMPVGALNLVWAAKDHTVEQVAAMHLEAMQKTSKRIGQLFAT